jgi:hypothetical protein
MPTTRSEPLLVPELAKESERLWLVGFASVAVASPDGSGHLRGQPASDDRALGATLRTSHADSIVSPQRQVLTCSKSAPLSSTGGVAGV